METEQDRQDKELDELLLKLIGRALHWIVKGALWGVYWVVGSIIILVVFFKSMGWLDVHAPWIGPAIGWALAAGIVLPWVIGIPLLIYQRRRERKRKREGQTGPDSH